MGFIAVDVTKCQKGRVMRIEWTILRDGGCFGASGSQRSRHETGDILIQYPRGVFGIVVLI